MNNFGTVAYVPGSEQLALQLQAGLANGSLMLGPAAPGGLTITIQPGSALETTDEFRQAIQLALANEQVRRLRAKLEELGVDVDELVKDILKS